MAINVSFNGINIFRPGYYGDPKAPWYNDPNRKPLLLLLIRLGVKQAHHYTFHL